MSGGAEARAAATRRRWALAFVAAAVSHAALGLALIVIPRIAPAAAPGLSPVLIDLEPEAAPPPPPEPEPEPPPPEPEPEPEPEPPPPEPEPLPEPPPEPPPEPVPEPPPETLPPPQEVEPSPEAPVQEMSDVVAPVEPAPAEAVSPRAAAARDQWTAQLLRRLARYQRYPADARERRVEGVAQVRVAIARDGAVADASLEASSGDAALDAEALALVARASPLPRPPSDVRGDPVVLVVPIEFYLNR